MRDMLIARPLHAFVRHRHTKRLAIEIRKLGWQSGQDVHATIRGADEPLPYLEAFGNVEDAGFEGFARKPTSLGYLVDVMRRPKSALSQ